MDAGDGLSVLVTRPPPGLDETMRFLRAAGHHPIAAPLLRVRPLSPPIGQERPASSRKLVASAIPPSR